MRPLSTAYGLRFPLCPSEPAIKCEIYQGFDQHRTAVTDWLISKPNIGTGGLCTNTLTILCSLSPIASKKVFAWLLSPENSPEARKSQASFLSTFYPRAECGQTHFCSCDVNRGENPSYPAMVSTPPKWTCHKVWNILRKSCSTFSWGIKEMREQLRLGPSHWLGQCRANTGGAVSKAQYKMGSECT